MACMHVTDFYTCRSFSWKTHGDGFFRPSFLVTDFFVAREHASDVHLGTCGSQNHNGTDHCVKLAVETDASCQTSDTRNSIDNHNSGVSPLSSSTTSLHNNLQLRVCHLLCCMFKTVPDWGKRDGLMSLSRSVLMEESEIATVADVLTNPPGKCLWLAISVRQTPKL